MAQPQLKSVETEAGEPAAGDPRLASLAKLRAPFPDNQVSKLPKETKRQADDRKADQDKGKWPARCGVCGGQHHPNAVHLDYVGHAAITDRLLDTDLLWDWEPLGYTPDGLPALDRNGGLWIKLTVCGKTRLGYGAADGKSGGDAMKEMIGDALRNAGMRFGAALDLWHKGELHAPKDEPDQPSAKQMAATAAIRACKTEDDLVAWGTANAEAIKAMDDAERVAIRSAYGSAMDALRQAAPEGEPDPFREEEQPQEPAQPDEPAGDGPEPMTAEQSASFLREAQAFIKRAMTEPQLRDWNTKNEAAIQRVLEADYQAIRSAWTARAEAIRAAGGRDITGGK